MIRPAVVSALSKEYVRVPVSAKEAGVVVNPTSATVEMAFVAGTPGSGDWKFVTWETDSGRYYARALVGPGTSFVLAAGRYGVWVRINGVPEIPVKPAGVLEVF